MKHKWFLTLFAAIPFCATALFLQSCGGEGGPTNPGGGGLPNVTAEFLALLSDDQKASNFIGSDACATAACHGGRSRADEDPIYTHWQQTAHAEKGVGCERCHGQGGAHQANPTKENILTFPKSTDPIVCAQCHGALYEQYAFSKHAQLIVAPVEEAALVPGTYGRNSRCVSCHSGLWKAEIDERGIDPVNMTDAEITEVAENTMNHVPHSVDCGSCHDPHSKTDNLTEDGEQAQLRHKVNNTDTTPIGPGALPASFTRYDHICAQCHNGRGTNPADARLTASTARPSMHDSNQMQMLMGFGGVEGNGPVDRNTAHASAPGQCAKCHMPDKRHSFTVSFDKGCSPCHTASDAAARVTSIKSEILDSLLALRAKMEAWSQTTFSDPDLWDYTSLITAEGKTPPNQSLVPIEVKRARHNYYFVIRSGDYGVHNAPYAKHLITVANQNMDSLMVGSAPVSRTKSNMTTEQKIQYFESVRARARKADMEAKDF